jgi:hypothetical protein
MNEIKKIEEDTLKLTRGWRGLLNSRKGTLCIFISLLAASLIFIICLFGGFQASICIAGFGMFGTIGTVISAIFCSGNTKEAIATTNAAALVVPTVSTSSLMGQASQVIPFSSPSSNLTP